MNNISYEKVINPEGSSFRLERYSHSFFEAPLHIHSQYELISIEQGHGLSFVGDSVHRFMPGDFMLIGKNLPHLWLSADEYYDAQTELMSGSVYSQFDEKIIPIEISRIPEFDPVNRLLRESQRGLLFIGSNKLNPQEQFRQLPFKSNFGKLLGIYSILYELSHNCEYITLTSEYYTDQMEQREQDKVLERTYSFISENYQDDISLEMIADYVGMNPSALCRYFKKKTGKTVFLCLSEIRISYAVKLLGSRNILINQVAYDCGYNNISHFNRQFKAVTGKTPSEYSKLVNMTADQVKPFPS